MFKPETTIRSFSSGEECLKSVENQPDIIILDYFLNGNDPNAMNGLQVLKKIKNISSDTKVIMLSAQDKMEIAVNLIKFGAYDYIIKNNNVFLRTKLVVSNAVNAISIAKELKNSKLMIKLVTGIIVGIVITVIALNLFYPALFMMGEH